jgi:hypothetical protein
MMGGEFLSQADLVDYPYLIDGDPTPAAYLLLCCADYLRLYPTGTTPCFAAPWPEMSQRLPGTEAPAATCLPACLCSSCWH